MKTRAAIAYAAGKPLEVVTVDLDGPRDGEVLVEIKASGVCHTDEFTRSGADPEGLFPVIFGHEGAGVVVDVGRGVTSLKVGDHVIPLYTPECRQCKACLSRKTNLCTAIRATQGKGVMPDGTSRFSIGKDKIHHYMGCSTFSNHTVLPEIALAKIRADAPFDKVCYIGCGVTTGIGAVMNTAKVEPGANVVVFGLGGIGLNVVQGAKLVGANRIIGVDLNPRRRALAEKFGMTDFVNPKEVGGDLVQHLIALTDGGADYSFECVGNVELMRQALECCHRGWGVSVIIGVAGAGQEIKTRPFQLVTGRVWKGTAFGGARGRTDVPKIVDWYMDGKINIDDLITHTMPLERHQQGVRPDALGRVDPQRRRVLVLSSHGVPRWLLLVAAMAAVGPVSIDMYLPGFPAIEREFGVRGVETTMAAYLVGIAVSQLFYGPISDRFGRKPPLYFGFALYALGAAGCALAASMPALTLMRVVQALGGSAGFVIGRAIVRDRCEPHEAARAFSLLMMIVALGPVLAPLGGGFVVTHFGWRATFVFQAALGVVLLAATHFYCASRAPSQP